jgi:hypothetical protein
LRPFRSLALALLAALAGCGPGSKYPIVEYGSDEAITREFKVFGSVDADPKVIGFVKPYNAGGKLALCQAFLVDGSEEGVKKFKSLGVDPATYIEFASADRAIRVSMIGARLYRVPLGGESRVNVSRLAANCGVTSHDWEEDMPQRKVTLALYKTTYTYTTTRIPIYVR